MRIFPHDILFFRESRDFSAGENHVAESTEPLPHTIAGAIMGAIYERDRLDLLKLRRNGNKLEKIPDPESWEPGFSLLGTFLGLKGEPLFPLPMDIVEIDGKPVLPRAHLLPNGRKVVVVESGEKKSLHFDPIAGFLRAEHLRGYLSGEFAKGEIPEDAIVDTRSVYQRETRIGIGLNDRKTTEEGLLYRVSALRFSKDASIMVYFDPNEEAVRSVIGERGTLKLGGESRFADFEFEAGKFPLVTEGEVKAGQKFRLYVATPVILEGERVETFIKKELNACVVKVFTDRLIRITGWDEVEKRPKPTYYAIPAGTVFWLKAEKDLTVRPRLGKMTWAGYGLVLIGSGWDEEGSRGNLGQPLPVGGNRIQGEL
ncbi:type III-B CRISPR module-associated protein Cmr3 [Thermococcus waiotapuensis]|uniref:Type III-B CRISPR module-associated protein Cmr3 n=1 Tax=Thermococcus waiotapuensis TaxID=90909 RepID=A0AAE4NVT7_9EURY|nr:type III-B CRISPR module-associated protein Cmr3 [Thermococcus waiotapuensis]MDV3104834.1 type III-B CRISPR module-associated protein Cmr3 [Thermococcus waiotapuensis]